MIETRENILSEITYNQINKGHERKGITPRILAKNSRNRTIFIFAPNYTQYVQVWLK